MNAQPLREILTVLGTVRETFELHILHERDKSWKFGLVAKGLILYSVFGVSPQEKSAASGESSILENKDVKGEWKIKPKAFDSSLV